MKKKYVSEKENIVVVPNYTNFIAVDSNGDEYAYATQPVLQEASGWKTGYWALADDDKGWECERINVVTPPKDFRNELYTWS